MHPRVDSAATPSQTTSDRALGSAAELVSGIHFIWLWEGGYMHIWLIKFINGCLYVYMYICIYVYMYRGIKVYM